MSENGGRPRALTLSLLDHPYAICRLPPHSPLPAWADRGPLVSIVRAEDELSILCPASRVPSGTHAESPWHALRVHGPFAFSEVGILAGLTDVLARARIPLLAISTHDTDYLFVKASALAQAIGRLEESGHTVLRGQSEGLPPAEPSAPSGADRSSAERGLTVRAMEAGDWEAVVEIYREGIATGMATFETSAPARQEWERAHLESCRLVAVERDAIAGWAALSPVSSRCVYGGVAEVSVYVGASARDRGVGRALLAALVRASEEVGLWALQAGILVENEPSIRLHRSCGFRDVGVRERLGKLRGEWRDVLLMERRSPTVGAPGGAP